MHTSKTKMNLTVISALVVAFSGCSHTTNSANTTKNTANRPVAGDKYSREIQELNQIILRNSNPAETKKAHGDSRAALAFAGEAVERITK